MKTVQKCLTVILAGCMCILPAACSGAETVREAAYELPYYDGNYVAELADPAKPVFNSELWRRADMSDSGRQR